MWDYGSAAENLAHYNKTKPPVYQYTGLQVPTIFFSGGNDYLGQFTYLNLESCQHKTIHDEN